MLPTSHKAITPSAPHCLTKRAKSPIQNIACQIVVTYFGKNDFYPAVLCREVYSRNYLYRNLDVHFSPTNGNLLLCDLERDWVYVLGQNETGSWFEHPDSWQGTETKHIKPYSDR